MFEREWLVTDHFRRMCREIFPAPAAAPEPPRTFRDRVRRFVRGSPVPTAVAPLVTPTLAQTRFLMAVGLGLAGLPDEAGVCERFAAGTETEIDRERWQTLEQWQDIAERVGVPMTGEQGMLLAAIHAHVQGTAMMISFAETAPSLPFSRLFPERSAAGCEAVRDIFGNPFRPVAFDPGWRTETAVGIARRIADTREYGNLPVLADALQDAGCEAAAVLDHCRDPGDHVPGCWVVEAVLRGNEPRQFILPRPPGSG